MQKNIHISKIKTVRRSYNVSIHVKAMVYWQVTSYGLVIFTSPNTLVANHTPSHCCLESSYQIRICGPERPLLGSGMWRHWYQRSAGSCGTTAGARMFLRNRSCPLVPADRNYPANCRASLSCKPKVLHIWYLCTEIRTVVLLRYRQLCYWDTDSCVTEIQTVVLLR